VVRIGPVLTPTTTLSRASSAAAYKHPRRRRFQLEKAAHCGNPKLLFNPITQRKMEAQGPL